MTPSPLNSSQDVVSLLKQQHQQIKSLFAATLQASGEEREKNFFELRRLLAVHETAEEQVVHPKAKDEVPGGESIVDARLAEEQEAKEALAELEDLDVDSPEFTSKLSALQSDVIEHAEHEEHEEFDKLDEVLDAEQLRKLAKVVASVEKMAPTRPHPNVRGRAANLIGGPFAAMMDRARDAMSAP
jgi:hemerythrin superfamily protein